MTQAAHDLVWERHHPDAYARSFGALLERAVRGEAAESLAPTPASAEA